MMQVSYLWPVAGAPPTAAQAYKVSTVSVGLNPVNSGDNSQILTHAFNLSNAQLTQGFPFVWFEPLDSLASGSGWYLLSSATNFVIAARGANTASLDTTNNMQVICRIERPWSGSK